MSLEEQETWKHVLGSFFSSEISPLAHNTLEATVDTWAKSWLLQEEDCQVSAALDDLRLSLPSAEGEQTLSAAF